MGRYPGGVLRPVDSGPQPLAGSAVAVGEPAATLQGAPDCVQAEIVQAIHWSEGSVMQEWWAAGAGRRVLPRLRLHHHG
jgi:hypothetical protein